MSVRRPQRDCLLCQVSVSDETARAIYYAGREAPSREAGVRDLAKIGIETTTEQLRIHMQYHRPVQPPPRKRIHGETVLRRSEALSPKRRSIINLVGHVPALSGTQLAELFYWNGAAAQMNSARAGCYRELAALVSDSYLYRAYPKRGSSQGKRARGERYRLTFYFLGRNAVPLLEATGVDLQRGRDWIAEDADLPDNRDLFREHDAAEVVVRLALQLREAASLVDFDPALWWGSRHVPWLTESRCTTAGVVVLRSTSETGVQLDPFGYEYDDGLSSIDEISDRLLGYIDLKREGVHREALSPLLRGQTPPPLLYIAADPYRLENVRRTTQQLARRRGRTTGLPIAICADAVSASRNGISTDETATPWISLWDTAPVPKRYNLLDILARAR